MHFLRPLGMKWTMLPTWVVLSTDPVGAQLVCYEGFAEYAAGAQVESGGNGSAGTGLDGGFGWGGAYDVSDFIKTLVKIENRTTSPVNYTNGEITIPGGNRALRFYDVANGSFALQRPLGTVFGAAAGDTLWFSVLFRTTSAGMLANQDVFQIGFDDSAPTGTQRVSIGAATISTTYPSAFQFFARTTADVSASAYHSSLPIVAATTYLLVGCIQPHAGVYDTVSLFVNPSTLDDPGPPSASVTLSSGLTTLSQAFIRTVGLDLNDAYVLDEWRIGRDYGSVVQSLRGALQVLRDSDLLTLRWPVALTGVVLETSATLEPDSWRELTGPFPQVGNHYEYPILIVPEIPRAFFRLRR
ncbi:MAG: hypothetical protein V4584_15860 [Verrucomicrobiota bacterium]